VIKYYRVFVGSRGKFATQALEEGWVGTGWIEGHNLTGRFPDNWKDFNAEFIPLVMEHDGVGSKVGAGLACSMTWNLGRGVQIGDIIISSDKADTFHIGKVSGDYEFVEGGPLSHRRQVEWTGQTFRRDEASDELRRSLSSGNTISQITQHAAELEAFIGGMPGQITVNDEAVENPLSFALERHLEDFLVSNWENTDLGKLYDLFEQDGVMVGRQFETDTGPIDVLAQSKDGTELVVIELKRGRVSDVVIGQILRYMGYVQELDDSKKVRGIIIGTEDDPKFRRALSMVPSVEFYRYEVSFSLSKS
jgi:restriction system protein